MPVTASTIDSANAPTRDAITSFARGHRLERGYAQASNSEGNTKTSTSARNAAVSATKPQNCYVVLQTEPYRIPLQRIGRRRTVAAAPNSLSAKPSAVFSFPYCLNQKTMPLAALRARHPSQEEFPQQIFTAVGCAAHESSGSMPRATHRNSLSCDARPLPANESAMFCEDMPATPSTRAIVQTTVGVHIVRYRIITSVWFTIGKITYLLAENENAAATPVSAWARWL
jgi:hypothetical protein